MTWVKPASFWLPVLMSRIFPGSIARSVVPPRRPVPPQARLQVNLALRKVQAISFHRMNSVATVRQAEHHELDELAALFDDYRKFQGQPSDPSAARQFLQARFDGRDSAVFIARKGAAAIGFTQLYPSYSSVSMARVFVLNDLFVKASSRRQGVAARLLAAAAAYAWSHGAVRLTLNVAKANHGGQAIYESQGWVRDQRFHMFHRYPVNASCALDLPPVTDSEVELRSANPSDAECLSALATQVFFETYATAGIRAALAREAQAKFGVDAILGRLADPSHRTTLAERDGHLVAFAEVALDATHALVSAPSSAELTRLYVQSPFLRRGLGRLLLQRSEALARAEGASTLWLTAWVGNTRARAFYASQGYEQLGSTAYTFEGESFENRLFARRLDREAR